MDKGASASLSKKPSKCSHKQREFHGSHNARYSTSSDRFDFSGQAKRGKLPEKGNPKQSQAASDAKSGVLRSCEAFGSDGTGVYNFGEACLREGSIFTAISANPVSKLIPQTKHVSDGHGKLELVVNVPHCHVDTWSDEPLTGTSSPSRFEEYLKHCQDNTKGNGLPCSLVHKAGLNEQPRDRDGTLPQESNGMRSRTKPEKHRPRSELRSRKVLHTAVDSSHDNDLLSNEDRSYLKIRKVLRIGMIQMLSSSSPCIKNTHLADILQQKEGNSGLNLSTNRAHYEDSITIGLKSI